MTVTVTLPDGAQRHYPSGTTVGEVAASIGRRLAQDAVGARRDGELVDVHTPLHADCALAIVVKGTPDGLEVVRHSAAHLMASAVVRLFPGTQVTIGPATESGFYYDFARKEGFTPEDLTRIEQTMRDIAQRGEPFVRTEVTRDVARARFAEMGETYKVELLDAIDASETITLYQHGDWLDLCRGPHVPNTKWLKAFKLTHVAGAYWRGNERNPMLARIYGTAFWTQAELEQHLASLEAAKARDHRKLGQALELFSFHPEAPAMPFFLPRGAKILRLLTAFVQGYYERLGFEEVITPQLFDTELFARSGHLANYRENMFFAQVDEREFALKPMNCPSHALLFGERLRSYRELPWRVADFGRLHRYERSGATAGLTRVRSFCQDDAHIFCREQQIAPEIAGQLAMIQEILGHFGFTLRVALSTRPEQSIGREPGLYDGQRADWDAIWQDAEARLVQALEQSELPYGTNAGDGAFYGPKIDCEVQDALGRWHQLATIQLDFSLPRRFALSYVDENSQAQRPVMVHRAVLGSLERFFGVLLEHTGGDLPLWLAPTQVRVMAINDALLPYAREVVAALRQGGLRAELDATSDKLGAKIRLAELVKIPVVAVVGGKEQAAKSVALRWRKRPEQQILPLDQAIFTVVQAAAVPVPSETLVARVQASHSAH